MKCIQQIDELVERQRVSARKAPLPPLFEEETKKITDTINKKLPSILKAVLPVDEYSRILVLFFTTVIEMIIKYSSPLDFDTISKNLSIYLKSNTDYKQIKTDLGFS